VIRDIINADMSQIKMGLRKLRGLMQKRKAILIFGIVVFEELITFISILNIKKQ